MNNDDLSPMPTPVTEEPELVPGGNPAVDDTVPDEIAQPDDTPQAPEGEADDAEAGTTAPSDDGDGPDAGQTAEDGSAEPPA